jgi:hypothetical protein
VDGNVCDVLKEKECYVTLLGLSLRIVSKVVGFLMFVNFILFAKTYALVCQNLLIGLPKLRFGLPKRTHWFAKTYSVVC